MKIPEKFTLIDTVIYVRYVDDLYLDNECVGQTRYLHNEILLQSNTVTVPRPEKELQATFLHEMVHFILYFMGENDLCSNEQFVSLFSKLLNQVIQTGVCIKEKDEEGIK